MEINQSPEGIGRVGSLCREMTLQECCEYVKEKLELETVKVFGDPGQIVRRLAVSPGSGKSAITPCKAETLNNFLALENMGWQCTLTSCFQTFLVCSIGSQK